MLAERYKFNNVPIVKLNALQLETKKSVEDKIKSGEYKFEDAPCVICGNTSDFELLSEKDRYGLRNPVVACRKCGLVQSNPRFTQSSFNLFYNSDYRPLYEGKTTATDVFFRQQYFRGSIIYKLVNQFKEFNELKNPFVLEVGCAAGGILKVFQEHGCTVKGIDLGEEFMKYGREKYGLDLSVGNLQNVKLERQPDLIIYSNVMEHITDPVNELNTVKQKLNPKGLLFIEVPGVKNIHNDYRCDFLFYIQNAHVYHFSETSLKNLFHKTGFELLHNDNYIRSVSKMSSTISNEPLDNDYAVVMDYLKATEKKRRAFPYSYKGIKQKSMVIGLRFAELIGIRGLLRSLRKKLSK